jgi:lipopolysaccharide/colanic/teichoic acid biosynthesis glycosyltransferase
MNEAPIRGLPEASKRVFDASCAAAGLVLLMPVFAALALMVISDDGLPVFFSQTRMGRNGRPFRIWKFRTMRAGSRGSIITAAGDGRITRTGAVLRKYKLDELPQLFNVLKGDMSLVGPRPEVPEHVQLEAPVWQVILQVRPGLTDLATLLYRDEQTILGEADDPDTLYRDRILPAKLFLNLSYLRSRSFWKDLKLIFRTIRHCVLAERLDPDLIRRTFDAGVGVQ